MKCLKKAGYLNGVVEIAWSCTNLYVTLRNFYFLKETFSYFVVSFQSQACLAIFGAYIASSDDKVLDARNAFVVVTVFNVMYIPLTILPILISHVLMVRLEIYSMIRSFSSLSLPVTVCCSLTFLSAVWESFYRRTI